MESELTVRKFNALCEIDETLWNSIVDQHDQLHGYQMVQVVEQAQVENSRFTYYLFYKQNELVGTAILSSFTIHLDLFLGSGAKQLIRIMRRIYPGFLKVNVLFCGLPLSLGQHHLVIKKGQSVDEVLAKLTFEMDEVAAAGNINYLCFKEFKTSDRLLKGSFSRFGYFKGHSIPYISMNISWSTFGEYLNDLRYPYRRSVLKSLHKVGADEPVFDAGLTSGYRWVAGDRSACSPEQFFLLYLEVMKRTRTKLETLNLEFFRLLYSRLGDRLKVLVFMKDQEVLSAGLLLDEGESITFMLAGNKYEKNKRSDPYFNLMNGILAYAINQNYKRLHLGQTAYWTKLRLGGFQVPEYFYFRSRSAVIHSLLHSLRNLLFPEVHFENPRVFKGNAIVNTSDSAEPVRSKSGGQIY